LLKFKSREVALTKDLELELTLPAFIFNIKNSNPRSREGYCRLREGTVSCALTEPILADSKNFVKCYNILMVYFVHPQIKFNIENLKNLFFSFFRSPDEKELKKLKNFFPQKELIFTDMARSAFKLIVEKMGLQNSEILFPAYICDIFFPILKEYNLSPIFLDIDKKTFHIKIEDIEKKITPETKSILVCHTYGLPIDIKKIREILIQHPTSNIQYPFVIEDCAHAFGATYNGIPFGNFGDAAFFSLYKQFPSLRGGLTVINEGQGRVRGGSGEGQERVRPSLLGTKFDLRDFVSLLNCFSPFAFLFKKFGGKIAPKMLRKEKLKTPTQINRVSWNLFLYFFKNFEENLKRRIELALFFQEELKKLGFEVQKSEGNVFCYLSALAPQNLNRDKFVRELRKYGIFATRIWKDPIILNPKVQKEYKINLAEFPNTIEVAKRIINFPLQNFYSKKDIEKMIFSIKRVLNSLLISQKYQDNKHSFH